VSIVLLGGMRAFERAGNISMKENAMNKDRVEGAARQVKGSIKEAVGKVAGDARTEAEGKAEKTAGKIQNAVGGAKDAARDALKK
jgi:uncharacterized protein YjbJ (UPF0337 family)